MTTIADELSVRSAIYNHPDGFCLLKPLIDIDGTITDFVFEFVNKAAGSILNRSPKLLENQNFLDSFPFPGEKQIWFERCKRVLLTKNTSVDVSKSILVSTYETGGTIAISFKNIDPKRNEKLIENKYQKYLELPGILFVVLKIDGTIEAINNYGAGVLGYKSEDIVGQNWFNVFILPEDQKNIKRIFNLVISGKIEPAFCYQNYLLSSTGNKILFSFNNTILKNDSGDIEALISVAEDITETKQRTEKLNEQARLLQSTNDAFMVHDFDNKIVFWNRGAEKMYGWSEKEAIGETASVLLKTQAKIPLRKIFDITRTKKIWRGELLHITKNGKIKIVDSRWELLDKNYILEVTRDITDSKKAEDVIKRERELLDKIINRIPVMITMYDPKLNILRLNSEFIRLTGWTEEDTQRKDLIELCYPDEKYRNEVQEFMNSLAEGWKDVQITTKDGKLLETSWSNIRLSNDANIGIGIDIGYRKELERRKDEFLNIASHELKTPLTTIKAYTQLLTKIYPNNDQSTSADYLNRMETQVSKLEELINDLLDISRIHEGKLLLHQENIDISQLIDATVKDIIAITNTGHKIIVKNNIQVIVSGDRFRLAQVLTNILNNAIKYSAHGSDIEIKTLQKNGQIIVSIKDYGVGIDEDKLSHIFEQFYQANNPIKTQTGQPGLGLGLYITAEIIRRHGGHIWVKSKKGAGSTFYFSLPLSE